MKFRTEIQPDKSTTPIQLKDPILTIGSCFADAIGKKLQEYKFKILVNPTGATYNPHSIHTQLEYIIHNQPMQEHTFLANNEIHLNYNFNSKVSALDRSKLNEQINEVTGSMHYFLKDARWIIITYGTAWVYVRKDTGEIVANCHKQPAALFDKELFTQKKILDSFDEFHKSLKAFNPNLNIIVTVSPVRHIKDSLSLNSVSKSVLRVACYTLAEQYPDVTYFPAYEIMLDDLRDYRFFESDLIHPSREAEQYIWEKFITAYFDEPTLAFVNSWRGILDDLNHKPFHPSTQTHQAFLHRLLSKLESVKNNVNVTPETQWVKSQITTIT